jgi:hypothetical protein
MKKELEIVKDFPYPYYQYGSSNSTDSDVIISIPSTVMPIGQELRKRFVRQLLDDFNLDWNATLAVFEDGVMIDTIYNKSWIDSLNNAFFETYKYHIQFFEIPVTKTVERNKTLAIYKAVRTVLTFLTRTPLRTTIKPILKGIHPFYAKLDVLKTIDFNSFETFNQKNAPDIDIWKIVAFYIGQNILLIEKDIEIYTKNDVLVHYPELDAFILRKTITEKDKVFLTRLKNDWLTAIQLNGEYVQEGWMLSCGNECIDMKNEKY